ncbi:DoxX family protein [Ancylobacter sp. A5.8]|uniref:DoxX family protein n=1 Tax=Ancylobacter gelatini TaxID=2919920 RepID=UPI001F4DC1D1|nr:DoxX family protein [Ancylobacter gelatini]MCJ8143470.1 DoxX family protein [Ancylobacter gelatini]
MITTLTRLAPHALSLLRVMAALLLMQHGTQKLLGFPDFLPGGRGAPAMFSLSWTAGVFELVGGLLLAIGLFTRPVAFVLSGVMAFAYFLVHAGREFYPINNGGELAALYCFVFFYFVFSGPGPWSVDRAMGRA